MPMITWKRAIAAALAAIAAGLCGFGLATNSLLWVAFGALLGGFILSGLVVGVYRRIGYQIMLSGQQGTHIEQMRRTVKSVAQSNLEIRRTVREVASWDLRPIVLDAFREIVVKVEGIEQRMVVLEEQLRTINGGISRVLEQTEVLETSAEHIGERVNEIKSEARDLTDSFKGIDRKLAGVDRQLASVGEAVREHAKATGSHWAWSRVALERLESVPNSLDNTGIRIDKVEKALNEARKSAVEGLAAAKQQAEALEQGAFTPIKRMEREFGNGALRFALVNDIAALTQLHDQVPPRATGPAFSGWALEPVPLMRMVEIILRERPALVVECGSGASTVLLAYALEKVGGKLIALEHLDKYAAITRSDLRRHGLEHVAEVRDAPIEPSSIMGETHDWYAKSAWSDLREIGLLLVDGPPKAIGPRARYPAIPLLSKALAKDAIVVLDDTHRAEEKAIMERWRGEFVGVGEPFSLGASTAAFRWSGE